MQPHGRDVGSIRRVQAHTLGCDLKDSQITLENHLSRERHPNLTLLKKKKKKKKPKKEFHLSVGIWFISLTSFK